MDTHKQKNLEPLVPETVQSKNARAYWRATLKLMVGLLSVWFLVSFGAGILFRSFLDNYSIGGAPLGFWFAQNGAIYVFLVLIVIYCRQMTRLEKKYGIGGPS